MKLRVWFATGLLLVFSLSALADPPQQPQMSPQQKAEMDAMMKAMTPGEQHKLLNNMVGTWDAKVTTWMQPGAPPMVSTGTATNSWILGGREIEERFNGEFMGAPFTGIGYTGYDNVKKTYWGTWMDSMSTGVMTSTGSTSDNGKTWMFHATMPDPMTGKDSPVDEKVTVADADHHSMEMWAPGPDGKMYRMMLIEYSRKK
jgi:Protein of unknown function (DUF1579)